MRRTLTSALCLLVSCLLAVLPAAHVVAQALDVDPPRIETEHLRSAPPAASHRFSAIVYDDIAIDSVRLYYRTPESDSYESITMRLGDETNRYVADVPLEPEQETVIEYYLSASDSAGNRTLQGYAFNPFTRQIVDGAPVPQGTLAGAGSGQSDDAVATSTEPEESRSSGSRRTIIYTVLGALAVGALAGLAASGGGDSGGGGGSPVADDPNGNGCGSAGCRLTVNIGQP